MPVLFSIISTNRNLLDFGVHIISRAFRKGVFCRKGSDGCQVLVKNFSDGLSLDEQTLTYLLTRYRSAWCSWGARKEAEGGKRRRRRSGGRLKQLYSRLDIKSHTSHRLNSFVKVAVERELKLHPVIRQSVSYERASPHL